MAWFFNRNKEVRNNEPHIEVDTSVCTEVNEGVGLLQKLLNLKGYDAMHQSPFFAGINLISNSIAQMKWEVKAYDDTQIPYNMYAQHLFDSTNLTQFTTIKNMIKDVLLYGNAFAYVRRDSKGTPIALEYLKFGECNIVYNSATGVLLYQAPRISNKLIEPINIIHLLINSEDGINGRSILTYAANTVKLNGSTEKAATDYFQSGMTVAGVLSTDSPRLTKEQRQSIRQAWGESQLGQGSGIAVLENGMKYSPVASNSKDGELLETRIFNITEVSRWLNISPILLGDLSKTSYNSVEQSQLQFVLNCLSPYIELLEQELNRKIIIYKDKPKYYIDIVEESIIKGDKTSHANYLTTLVNAGLMTRNEARKQLGLPAMEGGDTLTVSYTDINQNTISGENKEDKNTENEDEE